MNESEDEFLKPFQVLGVAPTANSEEVRTRYLELIKQFPPERDAERFQEIQKAYAIASDPIRIAKRVFNSVMPTEETSFESLLNEQLDRPPRMSANFVLSLGNCTSKNDRNKSVDSKANVVEQGQQ